VLKMSTCIGDPLAVIKSGEVVRLHSEYNSTHAADDVMGIMLGTSSPTERSVDYSARVSRSPV
jgi:hypothetical protein